MSEYTEICSAIHKQGNKQRARNVSRFFKTGPGEYGEGDIFLGLTVPMCRLVAQKYKNTSFVIIKKLLASKIHEERLIALLILVDQFTHGDKPTQTKIFNLYLLNTKHINNWDLVDLSADKIIGEYVYPKSIATLKKLAQSKNLWEKRIAMVATFAFIKKGEPTATFSIAQLLIHDRHDLIHKACGWMLREVGKRVSKEQLQLFLKQYTTIMPRTMLRYAIEHFPEKERKRYLLKVSA
jgi:3-methyladenine DNA glycosylase AlkD